VLGSQVQHALDVDVDASITIRGTPFRVVGVLETTFTGPDSFVFMPFSTAQHLLIESEPLLRRLVMAPGAGVLPIATAAAVFWTPGEDPERIGTIIRERIPNLSVVTPADATAQLDRALAALNGLIVGSGLVALIVASLAVTNTMFTAVVERRREIGLVRVAGATRRQVIGQLMLEAAVLGVAGSVLGLAGGSVTVAALNLVTQRLGASVFLLTGRLALAAGTLPAALAALAGLWPAWRAAHLAPTEAIRYA
jgi:ABC-type antimicrobial peptide transport system permease subunit